MFSLLIEPRFFYIFEAALAEADFGICCLASLGVSVVRIILPSTAEMDDVVACQWFLNPFRKGMPALIFARAVVGNARQGLLLRVVAAVITHRL